MVHLYLYTILDQRFVDMFDQVEYGVDGVNDRLYIYHLFGIFYFLWHRHQIEGTNGLVSRPKDTCRQCRVNGIVQVSTRHTNHSATMPYVRDTQSVMLRATFLRLTQHAWSVDRTPMQMGYTLHYDTLL